MAAKAKTASHNNQDDSFLDSNKNVELEKKIDALLSIEADEATTPAPRKSKKSIAVIDTSETEGVPLLPSEKIPVQIKEPTATRVKSHVAEAEPDVPGVPTLPDAEPVVAPKFYEPLGPKPVAPEKKRQSQEPSRPQSEPAFADNLDLEAAGTGRAVEDIIAAEADELLEVRDRRFAEAPIVKNKPQRTSVFRSRKLWVFLFLLLFVALGAVAAVPSSRYATLNAAGVRSAASVTVLDESTGQPLKSAEFSVSGVSGRSDTDGVVRLENLKLGPQSLTIKKNAFAETSRPVTIGWGSNPLGEFRLQPVGSQYKITVVDFLSKKPIAKVEAASGDSSALSNDNGEIVLTVPREDIDKDALEIELKGEGLRTEKRAIQLSTQEQPSIEMVPSQKHVFITKRSGTYDVYKVDVDGKNEEKVLSGTGTENPDTIALSSHPSKNIVALVSTRDATKTKNGSVLSTLSLIDVDSNKVTNIAQSERVQLLGWVDDKLIYVKIGENEASDSTKRHRLVAYNITAASERELASTNYFNDIMLVNSSIYYTPASFAVNGSVGLYKINSDGNEKRTVYDKEVWNIFRTSYGELSVSMGQDWYTLNLDTDQLIKAPSAPAVMASRFYVPNADASRSLWTEERDGKGTLLMYDTKAKSDTVLQSKPGIKNPLRWLNGTDVIYRVSNNQETADYIFNTTGGEPRKIKDVTDTAGIDRWYYY